MKISTFFLALLLLLGSEAYGAGSIPNGAWWNGLSDRERSAAAQSLVYGYAAGYSEGLRAAGNQSLKFTRAPQAYIVGIDDFYVKNPSLAGVSAALIVPCLADNAPESCENRAKYLSGK